MATLLECLRSLQGDLVMKDLSAVRDPVVSVAEHIARLSHDQDGYEVRKSVRNHGRTELIEIGLIGGRTVFRQD